MTALTFAVLALTATQLARTADSTAGHVVFVLIASALFAAGLINADWGWVT